MKLPLASALILSATPLLATTQMVEVRDRTPLPGFGINADIADDLDVFDADGRRIGEVEEIIGSDRQTPEAVAVDFEDHIAGPNDEDRILPLSSFTFDGSGLVLAEMPDIASLPVWRD